MTSISRLTFASVWGFEITGTKELQDEFKKTGTVVDCHGDYNKTDDVLVLKGRPEGPLSKAAGIFSRYIEEQASKDLLDEPRVYRLDVPAALEEDPVPDLTQNTNAQEGDLLALGASQDEEVIPHSRITKLWVSPDGGAGRFSQFQGILSDISKLTGTEIAFTEDLKGIQVSGKNENDVEDALAKINGIHRPLMCFCNPQVVNMGMLPEGEAVRLQMQYYSNLNQAARRRILADPTLGSTSGLYQSYVTISQAFDSESQVYKLPINLLNPPQIGDGPGEKSRIWADFTFPEVGKSDQFNEADPAETSHSDSKSCPVDDSPSHRYLSAAKAMQVDKWVHERAEIEQAEPASELSSLLQPYEPKPAPSTMKPPVIRSRRAVPSEQVQSASPSKPPTPQRQPHNAPGDDKNQSPRKKWKMTYVCPNASQAPENSIDQSNKEMGDREKGALCATTSNITDAKILESKPGLPSISDATKYASHKFIHVPAHNPRASYQPKTDKNPSSWPERKHQRGSELIDISVPACTANTNGLPRLFADQPALIPEKQSSGIILKHNTDKNLDTELLMSCEADLSIDVAGIGFETDNSSSPRRNSIPSSREAVSSSTDTLEHEKRLEQLKKMSLDLDEANHTDQSYFFATHRKPVSKRHANEVYGKERLTQLNRLHGAEMTQSTDELTTRKYHHIMNQKTAMPIGKAKGKAEVKAKRQATLEAAWGLLKKPTKKADEISGIGKASGRPENASNTSEAKKEKPQNPRHQADALRSNEDIKQLFRALRPTLEAAEYFPGTLTLELQFGLLLIPLLPKTYREMSMSLDEWTRIFQPQTGIAPPTTKFISRLTTSGSDVDHIVDMKTPKVEGKQRMFEREDSEWCVSYEYHCRTKSDNPIIIVVNDQGKHTIKYPTAALGGVNFHFPGQTWDAHLCVSGGFAYRDGSDPDIEQAAQQLVDHIRVRPNETLIHIFTQVPKDNKLVVDKVFMKRWTRHRYIRPENNSPNCVAHHGRASSTGSKAYSTNSPGFADTTSQDSRNSEVDANVDQHIFLQVTEVQDLIVGERSGDIQARRARCLPLLDMLKAGRQWYEVSLVSPAIEAILKTNTNLEVGERTDDWRSSDLFGNDAPFVCDKRAGSAKSPTISPVASAVGDAGIGNLLRLAKKIIGNMDAVGYWNYNPQADTDAVRMPPPSSLNIPPATTALTAASLKSLAVNPEPKGFNFDELESIKDVGSATRDVALTKKSSPVPSFKQQAEAEYW